MKKPIDKSYQVDERVFAGEYARDKNDSKAKIKAFVDFGITHFIDLTEEGELSPYNQGLPNECSHHRFPIRDVSVPYDCASVFNLMQYLDSILSNPHNKIYIHCWGGVGRTGLIVACYYVYHGEDYEAALRHLRESFKDCPKSSYRHTPETKEQEDFVRKFASYVASRESTATNSNSDTLNNAVSDSNISPIAFLEKVLNWTLPGLQFLYRDTDLSIDSAALYSKLKLFRAGFFIDCSAKAGKLTKKTRFIIASAHSAPIWAMMPHDEDMNNWRMHTLHFNSYFKVMDVYQVGDKTQVLLLHIPYQGIPLFSPDTSMQFNFEGVANINLVEMARKSFDTKMQMDPIPALESEAWIERTFELPGTNADGIALFDPQEAADEKVKSFSELIHNLAKDDDDLNKPIEQKAEKKSIQKITPNNVTSLQPNEVFVFGSNLGGRHGGGAARVAYEKFGAVWGEGVGLHGQTYAIPTMHGGVKDIEPYVNKFCNFVWNHPEKTFLVTRIGCGIAGFKDEDMAPLFADIIDTENVALPQEWVDIIHKL